MGARTTRQGRALAVAVLLAGCTALSGCGVFFVARQGTKLYSELSSRNETMAKQRAALRSQLWPELQARCRKTPDLLPAAVLPATHVAFDEDTAALVRDDQMRSLGDGVQAERLPLKDGRPQGVDAFLVLDRAVLRSEPALTLTSDTLRIEDRAGRVLGRTTQFAFDWQAQTSTEYRSCSQLLATPAPPADDPSTHPDLSLLGRAFGTS